MNEFMRGLRTNLSATIATSYLCKQCCQTIQAILCFYARYPQVVSLIKIFNHLLGKCLHEI